MANVRSIMRTPVRNSLLGVRRGSRVCASSVLPSWGVPLPFTTARRGGIRLLAGAASRVLTLRRPTTGTAGGRPLSRRRRGRPPLLARRGAAFSPAGPPPPLPLLLLPLPASPPAP